MRIKVLKKISPFLFIFLFSCGIENIIYLYPPSVLNNPSGQSDDNLKYFEIDTATVKNNESALDYFKGCDIFYRIYESESDCTAGISSANKKNESNPSGVVDYLLSSLSYKFLGCSEYGSESRPLIKTESKNVKVRFRLTPYSSDRDELSIDGKIIGRVLRYNAKGFDDISIEDGDVKKASSKNSKTDNFYVACFAASYGTDQYFKPIYSKVVYLGYIKIPRP